MRVRFESCLLELGERPQSGTFWNTNLARVLKWNTNLAHVFVE